MHAVIGPEARKVCRTPDKPKVGDLGAIWGISTDYISRTSQRDVYNALDVNTRPSPRSDLVSALYPPGYASLTWGSTYFSAVLCSLSNLEQSAFGDDEPLTVFSSYAPYFRLVPIKHLSHTDGRMIFGNSWFNGGGPGKSVESVDFSVSSSIRYEGFSTAVNLKSFRWRAPKPGEKQGTSQYAGATDIEFTEEPQIERVEYYDINGRRIQPRQVIMMIEHTVYSNGSTTVRKHFLR